MMSGDRAFSSESATLASVEARTRTPEPAGPATGRVRTIRPQRSESAAGSAWKRKTHFWLRWAHVYISMFSLLVMLFFGVTGITLNHPTWGVGSSTSESFAGALPDLSGGAPEAQLLAISEFVRAQHGVKGQVIDFTGPDGAGDGTISYRAPGYSADLFFSLSSGAYELTVNRDGLIAVMNELHQGRESGTAWRWVIDIAGVLLVVVALTGIGIQLFLRKRRTTALALSAVGAAVTLLLIWIAMSGGSL